ncbi:ankyrin repeat domain-containing protein [Paenibacillus humicola]|uniref:ankyrin repeat domain-containing protein n=1 Tax=Paenibacillus humicola TaxID=3110540 RepID=UPI00237BD5FB|nr:ankyrin repeat domain-containing protein [Paenibacillus humicola]
MIGELFSAARSGNAGRLKELLESDPALANAENADGLTPLGFASHFGQAEAVRVLLQYGADVNAVSHSKIGYIPSNTALHAAIAGERNRDVIRLLLAHGARTSLFDSSGYTCLHTAAFHILQLLIEHGADVNARAGGGGTPLAIANERGNLKAAAFLKQHAAV